MEHGILVVKPDGNTPIINAQIEAALHEANLKIIEQFSLKFTFEQAKNIFSTTTYCYDDYYSYLSSDYVQIMLIRGNYAISKLQEIKYAIRRSNMCEKNMRNLIHTSDTGNEYKLQFQKLFPHLKYNNYLLFADLHIPYFWLRHDVKELPQHGGIIINSDDFQEACRYNFPPNMLIGIRTNCCYSNYNLPIISYFLANADWRYRGKQLLFNNTSLNKLVKKTKEIGGVCIVDYMPFPFFSHETVSNIKNLGVSGFKVFDLRYSLSQIEKIRYYVKYKYKMLATGGTNPIDGSVLTVDQEIYSQLVSRINYETHNK